MPAQEPRWVVPTIIGTAILAALAIAYLPLPALLPLLVACAVAWTRAMRAL